MYKDELLKVVTSQLYGFNPYSFIMKEETQELIDALGGNLIISVDMIPQKIFEYINLLVIKMFLDTSVIY